MNKFALLIGVSEYGDGFKNLSAVEKDIEDMERVLSSKGIGDFNVQPLLNPTCQEMEKGLRKLFANRSEDDLILIYFSGHGIRHQNGTLYLATSETHKDDQDITSWISAFNSEHIGNLMDNSKVKEQVLILDCCFSGAFQKGGFFPKGDHLKIDIKAQLSGEGRAVLTSSTQTQVSLIKGDYSIYTHYIVDGIETGAADQNSDSIIDIGELHAYAKSKTQNAAPTMTPKMYAIDQGYMIKIARAHTEDPHVKYRQEAERCITSDKIYPWIREQLDEFINNVWCEL